MLNARFLAANPEDFAVAALSAEHKASLAWLKDYFGDSPLKENPLRTIRDKAAFHYDKLNLEQAVTSLAAHENVVYLAEHPANSLYYVGSSLVFRTVFAMIADSASTTTGLTHGERTNEGFRITIEDSKAANWHMHLVLYGLMRHLLEIALAKPLDALDQVRINVSAHPTEIWLVCRRSSISGDGDEARSCILIRKHLYQGRGQNHCAVMGR